MMAAVTHRLYRSLSSWNSVSHEVIDSIRNLPSLIHKELKAATSNGVGSLEECSHFLFDGRGKAIRPTMVLLMAGACNATRHDRSFITPAQRTVAMVTEMIHTATLIHDDIIDRADMRRGKPSVNRIWGERKAVLTGNFILAEASRVLSSTDNAQVIDLLSNVLEDLVRGEVMQLSVSTSSEIDTLFEQYLEKTFKKTASLMAYSCQAVALLSEISEEKTQSAFEYGKNAGLAFQIVDDVLDFQATQSVVGKPVTVDLKLGLATAPVLYALEQKPQLYELIKRQFQEPGDIDETLSAVHSSCAIAKSMSLASRYMDNAVGYLAHFKDCPERRQLNCLTNEILERQR